MLRWPFVQEPTVQHASQADIQAGVKKALAGLGMPLSQLREQARSGQFSSQRARLVWSAIRDVAPQD